MSPVIEPLGELTAGQRIVFGGDRVVVVDEDLAAAFSAGDRLVVVQSTGSLLHIPAEEHGIVDLAVSNALDGLAQLAHCSDDSISGFFHHFAASLDDDAAFAPIAEANRRDVDAAVAAGRSTTRLVLSESMRTDMAAGLRVWRDSPAERGRIEHVVAHDGWTLESRRAPLGVVGFVFEGRPNVFADACGVVRTGNTVVFRIGSDALQTARAIVEHALAPALARAGLPPGTVQLIDAAARSAGHALFDDRRLALAVARGSGRAVAELGAVAMQAGTPVSLHGTGGAWMIAGSGASAGPFGEAVEHSLDRKVCNTLNVCVVTRNRAVELIPVLLEAIERAATRRGTVARVHVAEGSQQWVPNAGVLPVDQLGTEWEWEDAPELSIVVTEGVDDAVHLANRYSPRFIVSVVTEDPGELERCYQSLDAPFVGTGFTRWVDGQYALDQPELGLSNWQFGRLLGRGAILSGDSVHTLRYVARVTDHSTHR
jgi:glutamate-5-semialdehyde dehydrogenase